MHKDAPRALDILPDPFTLKDYQRIMRVNSTTATRFGKLVLAEGLAVRKGNRFYKVVP